MAGYVSNVKKQAYLRAMNRLHETFARDVIVWKTPERTVISSNPDYNFLYNDQENIEVTYTPVSGVFDCRILWGDASKLMGHEDIKEEIRGNVCRIKAKLPFVEFLKDAERIEIDSRPVQLVGTSRPHGLLDVDFYTLFFKESE